MMFYNINYKNKKFRNMKFCLYVTLLTHCGVVARNFLNYILWCNLEFHEFHKVLFKSFMSFYVYFHKVTCKIHEFIWNFGWNFRYSQFITSVYKNIAVQTGRTCLAKWSDQGGHCTFWEHMVIRYTLRKLANFRKLALKWLKKYTLY